MKLESKTAVITGAAAGIGRAAALLFAAEGAEVAVLDIDEDGSAETVRLVLSAGGVATAFACDLTQREDVEGAVSRVVDTFGKLDILYNNAGGSQPSSTGSIVDVDLERWWGPLRLDLFGTLLCCRFAIPHLLAAGGGAIVNTASVAALRPQPGYSAYGGAKAGVIVLTKELAAEFAGQGIRVNAVAAAYTRTARVEAARGSQPLPERHLLGIAEPDDVAAAALFLASSAAARITGVVLPVDSGFTL